MLLSQKRFHGNRLKPRGIHALRLIDLLIQDADPIIRQLRQAGIGEGLFRPRNGKMIVPRKGIGSSRSLLPIDQANMDHAVLAARPSRGGDEHRGLAIDAAPIADGGELAA